MFRLASHLNKHVSEIESYTQTHLIEWQVFEEMHPFSTMIQEQRFRAIRADISYYSQYLAYVIMRVMTGKGDKPTSPDLHNFRSCDFESMKSARANHGEITAEQTVHEMELLKATMNGKDVK